MKKPPLKLNDLKIQSFVTTLDKEDRQTEAIKGGVSGEDHGCSCAGCSVGCSLLPCQEFNDI